MGKSASVAVQSNVTASNSYSNFARQNMIYNASIGIAGGKYQSNLTMGCSTPYGGGTDAGGNN